VRGAKRAAYVPCVLERFVDGWHRAAALDDLQEGRPLVVEVEGRLVAVLRMDGRLVATDAQCPHKFGDLAQGTWQDGCVTCPVHEATFDCTTGVARPGSVTNLPLPIHAARVHDGHVEVRLDG
jgi:nitrite reductase/ring-hydroxylating ferredoxin subunit